MRGNICAKGDVRAALDFAGGCEPAKRGRWFTRRTDPRRNEGRGNTTSSALKDNDPKILAVVSPPNRSHQITLATCAGCVGERPCDRSECNPGGHPNESIFGCINDRDEYLFYPMLSVCIAPVSVQKGVGLFFDQIYTLVHLSLGAEAGRVPLVNTDLLLTTTLTNSCGTQVPKDRDSGGQSWYHGSTPKPFAFTKRRPFVASQLGFGGRNGGFGFDRKQHPPTTTSH